MTTKTTTAKTPAWLRFSRDVDTQCERNTTPAQVEAAYQAYLKNNGQQGWTSNGAQTYRDAGSDERYTVGYGAERTYPTRPAKPAVEPATEKQCKFIDDLLVKREHIAMTDDVIEGIKANKAQASRFISFLLEQPKVQVVQDAPAPLKVEVLVDAPRARLDFSAIPDGYYALVDGVTKFYRVSTSKRNGFKNVQVQASDNLHMLFGKAGIAVLHKLVEAGLKDAQALYASELGRCYVCGRTLTDEESRAAGIGPICRDKM